MNLHGDLSRHLIRNYLYEFVGNPWICGYVDMWIYGYVDIQGESFKFCQNFVEISSTFLKFRPNFVKILSKFRKSWALGQELEGK